MLLEACDWKGGQSAIGAVAIAIAFIAAWGLCSAEESSDGGDLKTEARKVLKENKKKSNEEEKSKSGEPLHVVVEAESEHGYRASESSTATKTDTPLFDTPLSVQVVKHELLEDQNATSIYDGVRNVSGVHKENIGGFNGTVDTFFIRGFRNVFLYYDGFMTESMNSVNPTTIERIEVLKGPSSMVYGLIEPGGVINIVPKKPKATPSYHVDQTFASYDYRRTDIDATGPITRDKKLLYRFGGNYTATHSFRDHVSEERFQVAPMLEWHPTDSTQVNFDLNYNEQHRVLDEGVSFTTDGHPASDIDAFFGEARFPGQNFSELYGHAGIVHRFNDHLTVRSNFLAHTWLDDLRAVRRSQGTPSATGTVNRLFDDTDFKFVTYQWVTEVLYGFDLGFTKHKMLFGIDLRSRDNDISLHRRSFSPTSISQPVYGQSPGAVTTVRELEMGRGYAGVYVQDQIELLPEKELLLLVGGRYDYVDSEDSNNAATPRSVRQIDRAWSWRTGVMWHPLDFMGVFGSASHSFNPTSTGNRTFDGAFLDPETGTQYEAGLKFEFLDKKVLSNVTIYDLVKDNVAIGDVNNPGFSINGGAQRARGLEFDIVGEVYKGLQIIGNYTYTDTKVLDTNANSLPAGARLRNVPLHSGSLWAKYTIDRGTFKNLGFGAGIFARGDMMIDDASNFKLPGYFRVDLAAYYSHDLPRGRIRASLNVKNATGAEFYESSLALTRVFPGQPRTFSFNLGFDF